MIEYLLYASMADGREHAEGDLLWERRRSGTREQTPALEFWGWSCVVAVAHLPKWREGSRQVPTPKT